MSIYDELGGSREDYALIRLERDDDASPLFGIFSTKYEVLIAIEDDETHERTVQALLDDDVRVLDQLPG